MSDLAATLARWCGIASHAADPAGQARMARELAAALGEVGTASIEPVGPAGVPLVRARSAERPGPRVLLVGHHDTVPHDGDGADPPVVVEDHRILARGAADMKGGLLVMLGALRLLEERPGAVAWEVVVVPDEEVGTPWSRGALAAVAERADAGLVFEPALPDGAIVRARPAVGTLSLEVTGRAAHAGRDPASGRSAIAALAELVGRVEACADPAAGTTVAVTTIAGGSATNVVPAAAVAEVDLRAATGAEADRALGAIAAAARQVAATREVAIEVGGGVHRPPKPVDPATAALFAAYRQGARDLGIAVDWTDVGGGSDANLIAAGGLPVLDGLGVVGGGLHSPNEYALIASLDERAAAAAALMARLTGS